VAAKVATAVAVTAVAVKAAVTAVAVKAAVTAVAVTAVAAKAAVTAVAVTAVAAKVAVTAVAVIKQRKIGLLELKAGKIVVMAMLLKMQMTLIKVVVEEEEELRPKGETILLQIMVEQNLRDFAVFFNAQHLQVVGQFFLKWKRQLAGFVIFHLTLVSRFLH
jgi:hypothetical protein